MTVAKTETDRRTQALADACRRRGMKVTHQRMEIFGEVAASAEHPDAESIYQRVRRRVPAISRDTVYRTLSMLETHGLVHKVEPLFARARYDANPDRHHHFVCTVCGLVSDFYSDTLDRLPIPEPVKGLGRIDLVQVQVRGVCSACGVRKAKKHRRRAEPA